MNTTPLSTLIVDDDAALLAMLESCFKEQLIRHINTSYRIDTASNVLEAQHKIETIPYDIAVLDYSLGDPEITGVTLMRQLLAINKDTRAIIITAFSTLELTLQAIEQGAYDFLTKPFPLDEFILVIRNASHTILLEKENRLLKKRLETLEASIDEVEHYHQALREQTHHINSLSESYQDPTTASELASLLDGLSAVELRRRRIGEQINAYMRSASDFTTFEKRIDALAGIPEKKTSSNDDSHPDEGTNKEE